MMADNNNNKNSLSRLHTKVDRLTRQLSRLERLLGQLHEDQLQESGAAAASRSGRTRVHWKGEAQYDDKEVPPPPTLEVGGRAKILPRSSRENPKNKHLVGRTGVVKRVSDQFAWVKVGEEMIQRSKKYLEAVV
jgi:hypothetical protein